MKSHAYTILFLAAAAAGLTGVYALVVAQASQQRAATLAQIAAKESTIAQLRADTAGLDQVQEKVDTLSRAVAQVESKLTPERELDRVLKDVWQMADADALQTQSIEPMNIERRGNYSVQPVKLKVSGDFPAFYTFLLQLERLPRLFRVTHMDLERAPDQIGATQATMSINIYFQPETGETASASPQGG